MSVSRRSLLRHSILAAIAFTASPFSAWSGTKKKSPTNPGTSSVTSASQGADTVTSGSLSNLDRAAFTGALGSSFQVSPASGQGNTVWLQLITVNDLPEITPPDVSSMVVPPPVANSPVPATSGFVLSFLGSTSQPLAQDTYTFQSGALGTFSLLLVPEADGQTYDAVINRVQ